MASVVKWQDPIQTLGAVAQPDPAAWGAYLGALSTQLKFDWSAAEAAYSALRKVRESLGLPFIDPTPKTETTAPDPNALTPDMERQAKNLKAMVALAAGALDDAVSAKRKVFWNNDHFVIEALPGDVLRLELDAQGVPRLVDAKTGAPTDVETQVGLGIWGAPTLVWVATATTSVLALPAYFIVDAAVNGLRVVAEQKTVRVLGEKAFDCVEGGKCTPEQAAAIVKAPYEGAAGLRVAAAKEEEAKGKPGTDWAKTLKQLGWVALGLGVIYAAVRFIPPIGRLAPAPARENPMPKPLSGYAYEHRGRNWGTARDEKWDTVVYTPTGREKYLGVRFVDDAEVNVWLSDGRHIAQTVALTGLAPPRPLPAESWRSLRRHGTAPTVTKEMIYDAIDRAKKADKKYQFSEARFQAARHGKMLPSEHAQKLHQLWEASQAASAEATRLEREFEKQYGYSYWQRAA